MIVSLKKHHAEAPVKMRRYFVMGNARIILCNVMVNVGMNITSLQIVMEPAHILWKIGFAILYVSLVRILAMENALKVKINTN